MTFVFGEFELDPARRELRASGQVQTLQPQVFDLLLYLVANHQRVVPKHELLESLWPDAIVTESSLQRAVSLARSALGDRGPELIQTFPRQGYRFVGAIENDREAGSQARFQPRYAQSGDLHIAYTTLGEGDTDIVVVNGWILPMRAMFQHPSTRGALEALSKIGRMITFDKRGTGLSDRAKSLPSHEQRMDDLRVVLEACNSEQAIVVGFSEGGALAMLYAATYPERTRGLVLCGAFARMTKDHDYPFGYAPEEIEKLRGYVRGAWGKGASLRPIAPREMSKDPEYVDWVAFAEQEGTSPGGALDLLDMNVRIDLRALLPTIRVPTAVLQASDDGMIHPGSGAYLAKNIPGARFVEIEGSDHVFFFETEHEILNAVRWVLEQDPPEAEGDRFLSTVLAAGASSELDEDTWNDQVRQFRGHTSPEKRHAYFDGPVRAVQCAVALANACSASFGVHTGQIVRKGRTVSGPAFELAEAIAARAPAGEVWASRVLVDLVPGTDLVFTETGESARAEDREIPLFSARPKS
ncbi:MAG: alpha/beta fold hydrolase [Polyangiales bacterium]